ncbi:MAG: NAD-dependent protein deacylase [Oscillospiraceae bacterium]|nr:NAD-dependent protein deacylase [Oscillospiraceae bacterium]
MNPILPEEQGVFEEVKKIVEESDNIVFFGGAGMSTESGVPDFRSVDGLYNQKYDYPPETILSHSFFEAHPDVFYEFYRDKTIGPMVDAEPNKGHLKLAEWEREGKLKAVITQNIDGLHQKAGSKEVLELHGSADKNYCPKCGRIFSMRDILAEAGIFHCPDCGKIVRSGAVLYEEPLDDSVVTKTLHYIRNADVLIVAGTSLAVYPAAGFINYYPGDKLIFIEKNPNVTNRRADYTLHGKAGEILDRL